MGEDSVQKVMALVDDLGDPDKGMSKSDWKDFLEELQGEIESRYEAVCEELEEEED